MRTATTHDTAPPYPSPRPNAHNPILGQLTAPHLRLSHGAHPLKLGAEMMAGLDD